MRWPLALAPLRARAYSVNVPPSRKQRGLPSAPDYDPKTQTRTNDVLHDTRGESYETPRDAKGRLLPGHSYIPKSSKAQRQVALKKFLDEVNGIAGDKRINTILAIAKGEPFKNADGAYMVPSIREQLDANVTLLYMQHGKPTTTAEVEVSAGVSVKWDPDKYTDVRDLEKYLELQKIGEQDIYTPASERVVDSEPEKDK